MDSELDKILQESFAEHLQRSMDSDLDKILHESFAEYVRDIKGCYYKGVWLPENYLKIADDIENFTVRDDDVWVCSFPRSGTTWTQEMVWCICNDLDYEKAKAQLMGRYFYLELLGATTAGISMVRNGLPGASKWTIDNANQLSSPRFFKSHLPYHLLPKDLRMGKTKAKIVYITRNVKDVCISYYHLRKSSKIYCGTFENYCRLFLENRLAYTPYWDHLIGYWQAKDSNNILFLKFEDMKKDLTSVIKSTANFFKKSYTHEQIESLCKHLSFQNMQINSATNGQIEYKDVLENSYNIKESDVNFIRKGQSEQWKRDMSEELIKKFDDCKVENLKKYPDLREHLS